MSIRHDSRERPSLEKLEVYQLARELSRMAWRVYVGFPWQIKKVIGDQFLESTDSVGANIAEGYGRFHYLDKVKFYYNARASLLESLHWFKLLGERKLLSDEAIIQQYLKTYAELTPKLNGLIKVTISQKGKK